MSCADTSVFAVWDRRPAGNGNGASPPAPLHSGEGRTATATAHDCRAGSADLRLTATATTGAARVRALQRQTTTAEQQRGEPITSARLNDCQTPASMNATGHASVRMSQMPRAARFASMWAAMPSAIATGSSPNASLLPSKPSMSSVKSLTTSGEPATNGVGET